MVQKSSTIRVSFLPFYIITQVTILFKVWNKEFHTKKLENDTSLDHPVSAPDPEQSSISWVWVWTLSTNVRSSSNVSSRRLITNVKITLLLPTLRVKWPFLRAYLQKDQQVFFDIIKEVRTIRAMNKIVTFIFWLVFSRVFSGENVNFPFPFPLPISNFAKPM